MKKKVFPALFFFVLLLFFFTFGCTSPLNPAHPGSLDTSFGGDGIATTPIGLSADGGYAVAIDTDGKIVVAGYSNNGSNDDFAVVRYTADGDLDTTFSGDGIATTPIGLSADGGYAVAIDTDGKIVVAGYSYNGGYSDFAVVRYTADGDLDTTFSGDGIVTTPIGSSDDGGNAVAIDSFGKIVVAGYSYNGGYSDFAVVRYTDTGVLDTSFGGDGIATTSIGSSDDMGRAVAIDSFGKIVVAGYSYNGGYIDFAVVRYIADGDLDTTFSGDGIVTTPIGSSHDGGYAVAIDSFGKIVVAGYSTSGGYSDFAVVRYTDTGVLDTSFGGDGIATTPIGLSADGGYAVAIDSFGKIVVAGYSMSGGYSDFAVVRYTATGDIDTTFGSGGKVTTPIGSSGDMGRAVAIDSFGKIVVAGYSYNGGYIDFAVVRYNP